MKVKGYYETDNMEEIVKGVEDAFFNRMCLDIMHKKKDYYYQSPTTRYKVVLKHEKEQCR